MRGGEGGRESVCTSVYICLCVYHTLYQIAKLQFSRGTSRGSEIHTPCGWGGHCWAAAFGPGSPAERERTTMYVRK